jgi:hypothetical protein
MLSPHFLLILPGGHFLRGFPIKIVYAFLDASPIKASLTCVDQEVPSYGISSLAH